MTLINHTFLVGAGGTGSYLAAPLARLLKYHPNADESFTIIDGDDFEEHNVTRQACGADDAGKNKAMVLRDSVRRQGLDASTYERYLSRGLLDCILARSSDSTALWVLAVDNDATRNMTLKGLKDSEHNFLWLSPGNTDTSDPDRDIAGNVLWHARIDEVEYGINPLCLYDNLANPQDGIPRAGGCMEHAASTPQLISSNMLAAALALTTVQNILDGRMPMEASASFFDGRNYTLAVS